MKTLYFADPIPKILCTGVKRSTFRVGDRRDIQSGDDLSLRLLDDVEFAHALCTSTKWTTFRDLTCEDWKGHERFEDEKTMLETYSNWEQREISMDDRLKIIRFDYVWFDGGPLAKYLVD
jgi:hypothetical protein